MLMLYADIPSKRLQYVVTVLEEIIGHNFRVTRKINELEHHKGPRLSYAAKAPLKDVANIIPHGLLREKGINPHKVEMSEWQGMPVFFQTEGAIPFDIFAASFYLLSRYEEYLPFSADEHGRFEAKYSLAYKHNFLHRPLVEEWGLALREFIKERYPDVRIKPDVYAFEPTINVDKAYAYKHKGVMHNIGEGLKSFFKGDKAAAKDRLSVLRGNSEDPYDTYDKLHEINSRYGIKPLWFFLLSDPGLFDRNLSPENPAMRALITGILKTNKVGLHPSYASNQEPQRLKTEIGRLRSIINVPVHHSRQHYTCIRMPKTYRMLMDQGITNDYSMGYATQPGFRASISRPFFWYHLPGETATSLRLHPFCFKDSTHRFVLKSTPEQALANARELAAKVRAVEGCFSVVFHNESAGGSNEWAGWDSLYEQVLKVGLGK
ncbi:MAG: polysaccharide deacetylase family protein [Bacteroidota bacterium]